MGSYFDFPDPPGLVEVCQVGGSTIYRAPNQDCGGWDYYSDSSGLLARIVDSFVSTEELEAVLKARKAETG